MSVWSVHDVMPVPKSIGLYVIKSIFRYIESKTQQANNFLVGSANGSGFPRPVAVPHLFCLGSIPTQCSHGSGPASLSPISCYCTWCPTPATSAPQVLTGLVPSSPSHCNFAANPQKALTLNLSKQILLIYSSSATSPGLITTTIRI